MPCLITAMLSPAVDKPSTLMDIPRHPLMMILSNVGFASAYDIATVSKDFKNKLFPFIKTVYELECTGGMCLQYTLLLNGFDMLQEAAFGGRTAAEGSRVLEGSLHYKRIKAILEDEFGLCIHQGGEGLGFLPKLTLVELLYNDRTALALPYLFDRNPGNLEWVDCL